MTYGQTQYQVRFDWGRNGAEAIGNDADVIVWVDLLGQSELPALAGEALVVAGSLRNRRAVAEWVLAQQGDKGERFMVAVVAAGETWADGASRFALEDLLGAGAVIDALADLGIDYCAPEAATAAAAYAGLRNATGHLIGASASGREFAATGRRGEIEEAISLDVTSEVKVLRESAARS